MLLYVIWSLFIPLVYFFVILPSLNDRKVKQFLKTNSTPASFDRRGKVSEYETIAFCVSIDGTQVKGLISHYGIRIASLQISPMGSISTYGSALEDIDIQILRNAGISVDSILKGEGFSYSSFIAPVATQKLIKYILDKIEEPGTRSLINKKGGLYMTVFAKFQRLSHLKKQTYVCFFLFIKYILTFLF